MKEIMKYLVKVVQVARYGVSGKGQDGKVGQRKKERKNSLSLVSYVRNSTTQQKKKK